MSKKQPRLKVIIHVFGLSRGPSSGRHEILPWDTRGHWKWVIWLRTNILMALRSFRGNFGLHEKWTNGGVQRLFEARQMVPRTCATLQGTLVLLGMFRAKIWLDLEKSNYVEKKTKIEGYNTRFRTFPEFELLAPRDTSLGHGRSLEMSHMAWKYMHAFTFISRQF